MLAQYLVPQSLFEFRHPKAAHVRKFVIVEQLVVVYAVHGYYPLVAFPEAHVTSLEKQDKTSVTV